MLFRLQACSIIVNVFAWPYDRAEPAAILMPALAGIKNAIQCMRAACLGPVYI